MEHEDQKLIGPHIFYLMMFIFLFLGAESNLAQGSITFQNFAPPIDAPVFHTDCQTRLEGDEFVAGADEVRQI
jgi:hypothetical protein